MYIRTENKIHYYKRDVKSGRIKTKRSYKYKKEPTLRLIPFICLESVTLKRRLSTLPLLRSTIDVVGLNFSVRNGKRWIPNAITTLIPLCKMFDFGQRLLFSNLRFVSINRHKPSADISILPLGNRKSRAISTTRLRHCCPYTCSLSTS